MAGTKRNRRLKRDASRTAVESDVAPDPAVVSLVKPEVWEPGQPPLATPTRAADEGSSSDGVSAALDRLAADVRALVSLARSAALPPEQRVADAERTAIQHLAELRARLDGAWDDEARERPRAEVTALPATAAITLDYTDVA